MEQYCEIGKAVSQRTEKGAAVAAAEYLAKKYPDVQGFSPRDLRRMRDFYCTYEEHSALLSLALQLGWTQNVVILKANLSMELRGWYIKASKQFGWPKAELTEKIATNAYEMINLANDEKVCYTDEQEETVRQNKVGGFLRKEKIIRHLIRKARCRVESKKEGTRRWPHYVMSDIHGEVNRFHAMLEKTRFSADDMLYILGDVIDRGADGINLLLEIMQKPYAVILLGNHEYMMIQYLSPAATDIEIRRWNRNGNAPTLAAAIYSFES